MMDILESAQNLQLNELAPSAYNIGINDGVAAGQTLTHLLPRYDGDLPGS